MRASFLDPCEVKILIVADGFRLNFLDSQVLSLSLLADYLRETKSSFVRFTVQTAHKDLPSSVDPHSDYPLYQFDNLMDFDEAWIFGDTRYIADPKIKFPEAFINNLICFMQNGRGVLGAGDHEDLGADMLGKVPRVRSMRKWFISPRNPDRQPESPSRNAANRRDTIKKGDNGKYNSIAELDDVPQEIEPVLYHMPSSPAYGIKTYPHPLLCGPRGPIKVLPDHMHEGECVVPRDLKRPLTGTAGDEYPPYPLANSTTRLAPQIVAWSNITEAHPTEDGVTRPAVEPGRFGAICVYDGHLVDVGRVVVQSSFHHFLYGNLHGFEISHKDEARFAYEDIRSYFQNLGIWLAPPEKQRLMFLHSLWLTRCSLLIRAKLTTMLATGAVIDVENLLDLGIAARRVHSRLTSVCFTLDWVVNLIDEMLPQKNLSYFLNPWLELISSLTSNAIAKESHLLDAELLVDAVFGGITLEIAKRFKTESDAVSEDAEEIKEIEKRMDEAVQSGLLLGLKALPALYNKLVSQITTL